MHLTTRDAFLLYIIVSDWQSHVDSTPVLSQEGVDDLSQKLQLGILEELSLPPTPLRTIKVDLPAHLAKTKLQEWMDVQNEKLSELSDNQSIKFQPEDDAPVRKYPKMPKVGRHGKRRRHRR